MLLCAGSAHWDIIARADGAMGLGDDVPGTAHRQPGGVAGNIARHLSRLGTQVALSACLGTDADGAALRALLTAYNIDMTHLHDCPKTDLYIGIEQSDGTLIAAIADTAALSAGADAVIASVNAHAGPALIDGNLPATSLQNLTHPERLFLVPASPARARHLAPLIHAGAAPLLNHAEAQALTATRGDSTVLAKALIGMGARMALVTDGPNAACLATASQQVSRIPESVHIHSVTGAGDATVAGLLHAHLSGASLPDALKAALATAAAHLRGPIR